MATCFLFTKQLDEEQCLCLRLGSSGQVEAPLALRPISEVRTLQLNARTLVVVPTESSTLLEVELPWLGERKARVALPYALEEQVAQNVATLHFAFDKCYYQDNRYLVVVTDKQWLQDLMIKLDALKLTFDVMTLDWFALREFETCFIEQGLLVRGPSFKGFLSGELATIYLTNQTEQAQFLTFTDSSPLPKSLKSTPIESTSSLWIAQRLSDAPMINLCQGELRHDTRGQRIKGWYLGAASLMGILLVSVVLVNAIYLHLLKNKMGGIDQKISVIYRAFFPGASQVISPKFRIEQLLKAGPANGDTSSLWFLLDKLAGAFQSGHYVVEQFRYQDTVLSVKVICDDFAALEQFEQRLKQAKVSVTQTDASSQKQHVVATLELSVS